MCRPLFATYFSVVIGAATFFAAAAGAQQLDWQTERLMRPSANQLDAESSSKIMIYDGLYAALVEEAMDKHFERIQNMMFVRTKQPSPEDENVYIVESDGCD